MAHGLFVTHDILSLVGRQEVDVRIGCGNHILKGNLSIKFIQLDAKFTVMI